MATWKKVKSIEDYMLNIIKDIEQDQKRMLKEMSEDLQSILYIYTQNFYNRYEPRSYERTYEFINSLTIRFIDDNNVEIGFDPEKMSLGFNNGWQQHEDRFYPLSQIINDGWQFRPDGSGALDEAIRYMNSPSFKREISNTFKKYGYRVK